MNKEKITLSPDVENTNQVTMEAFVKQLRQLMSYGSRGEELSAIVGDKIRPEQLFSPNILQQRDFYFWIRNVLEAGEINNRFQDHLNEKPVTYRIIRGILAVDGNGDHRPFQCKQEHSI